VPGDEDVLIDDDAPSWITFESTSNTPLGWTSAQAASGSLSLVHPYRGQGTYVTGIANLAQPLVAGSKLSLYALVDSCSPPVRQIHLRITTSAGSGTVSWGEPVWDVDPSTLDRGPVPTSGSWTRLDVPLDALELDSGTLTRIDIAHVDGRVWFDRVALWPLTRAQLTSFVSDHESTVSVGTTVTWTATATGTVQPVQYRFERRDDLGNWSIVQPYGMQASYTWTPTAADIGTNAVRVSVRNGGSTADFEDTATLLVRVVEGGEGGLWLRHPDIRFAWWKRWFEPRVPLSLGVHYGSLTTTSEGTARRHSLYTPELQLLAETEITTATTPAIAYEYIWFAGQPLAQIATPTGAIDWYFNDHLGTPILQTDADANLVWRVEYDPYGTVFSVRTGAEKHQPLRFPGQENDGGAELSYNVFRHYRASWGRYTQADPLGRRGEKHPYAYGRQNPLRYVDPRGTKCTSSCPDCPKGVWLVYGVDVGFTAVLGSLGYGASAGVFGAKCLSSSKTCTFFAICSKLFGAGAWAGVEGNVGLSINAPCAEDIAGIEFGIEGDIGKGPAGGFSVGIDPGANVDVKVSGGLGIGASATLTLCDVTLITCH
jgi:RHS repeat-associated protein